MGMCANENAIKRQQNSNLTNGFPKLIFNITHWPNSHHVNFKDLSKIVSTKFQVELKNGEQVQYSLKNGAPISKNNYQKQPQQQLGLKSLITKNGQNFKINFFNNQLWKSASKWMQLNEKDTYRIGNTTYKLIRFVKQGDYMQEQIRQWPSASRIQSKVSIDDAINKCRVCYSSKETMENPFINPCKCSGSIEFIHLQCLSNWLFGDISAQTTFLSLDSQKSCCQICKTNISDTQAYRSIIASILSGKHKLAAPFLIMEGRLKSNQGKLLKNYIILSFAQKKQYKIGRSKYADIFDKTDLYISRINSIITEVNGKIFIKDYDSKHGTGVQVNNDIILSSKNNSQNLLFENYYIQVQFQQQLSR